MTFWPFIIVDRYFFGKILPLMKEKVFLPRKICAINNPITYLKNKSMIVVPVKEGENIEKALKKFKRKFEKTGIVKELRARQQFNKPSVIKRLQKEHAVYIQKLQQSEE